MNTQNEITRMDQATRRYITAALAQVKYELINTIADGWTGKGRGCKAGIVWNYQCPTQKNGMNGTITLVVNRDIADKGIRHCVNALNTALEAHGVNDYFTKATVPSSKSTKAKHTISVSFDLAGYNQMEHAA